MNIWYVIASLVVALSLVIFPFIIYYGDSIMVVHNDSMLPTLKPYDMIAVKPTPISEIKVGDIIALHVEFEDIDIVSHRVVKIIDNHGEIGLLTKGDNVDAIDEWVVDEQDLIGKVAGHIPSMGILLISPVRYAIITFIVILSFGVLWKFSSKRRVPEKTNN